jgi:hypothetical protein
MSLPRAHPAPRLDRVAAAAAAATRHYKEGRFKAIPSHIARLLGHARHATRHALCIVWNAQRNTMAASRTPLMHVNLSNMQKVNYKFLCAGRGWVVGE